MSNILSFLKDRNKHRMVTCNLTMAVNGWLAFPRKQPEDSSIAQYFAGFPEETHLN